MKSKQKNLIISLMIFIAAVVYFYLGNDGQEPESITETNSDNITRESSAAPDEKITEQKKVNEQLKPKRRIDNKPTPPPSKEDYVQTEFDDELELPADLEAQLNAEPPELPDDMKRQLETKVIEIPEELIEQLEAEHPTEVPEDIKKSLESGGPRYVTEEEVNGVKSN